MSEQQKKIIAVFGATGAQGSGVVDALHKQGQFMVRAISRDASKTVANADEVVAGDLNNPQSLAAALKGAYGVFLVTNAWDGPGIDELAQGTAAVNAAQQAGVKHLVWSTLPNVEQISGDRFDVEHFTQKAKVEDVVAKAGFDAHTFVEAPFYFQNLTGVVGPQPTGDGSSAWAVPMSPDARTIHMGDISQLGTLVAGAFAQPEKVGSGQHLSLSGSLLSWNDVVATLREQGHNVAVNQVPGEVYDGFYPGAKEMRAMFEYFEAHTYFGPDADSKIAQAREVASETATDFASWAKTNIGPNSFPAG